MTSVVLVHGIRTSSSMWIGQRARLDAAGLPNVAVDLPGHGAREGEPFSLAGCRDVLDEAVATLPSPHVVVGLSLGSYVALDWAARGGGRPAALVLASAGTRPRGVGLRGYVAVARLIGRLPDGGRGLHTWMARRVLDAPTAADLLAGGVAVEAMVPTLTALGELDVVDALARVEAPIWFVNGRRDHFRIEEQRLLRAAPRATLVIVPRAGHLVALDQPEAFFATVAEVVEQADGGR